MTVHECCLLLGHHAGPWGRATEVGADMASGGRDLGLGGVTHGAQGGVAHEGGGVGGALAIVQLVHPGHAALLLEPRGEQVRGGLLVTRGGAGHYRGRRNAHIVAHECAHLVAPKTAEAGIPEVHVRGEGEEAVAGLAPVIEGGGGGGSEGGGAVARVTSAHLPVTSRELASGVARAQPRGEAGARAIARVAHPLVIHVS